MIKKDVFFVLLRVWDKEKILSSHEELNLWPSYSALWCSTTEPESEQKIWKSKFDCCDITMVIWCMLWCSTTELELERRIWRSEVQFLMGTQNFFFVTRLWQDQKHLSLFLHWAQNLPSLLFFLQAEWYLPFDWFLLMIYWKQMHKWSHNREIFFLYHITLIDSMLPWICSAVDHRRQ